jgi:hypothetical protein
MVEWKSDGKLPKSVQDQRSALRDKLARRHFRPEINAADLARKRYLLESEVEPPAQVIAREIHVARLARAGAAALPKRTRSSKPSKLKK